MAKLYQLEIKELGPWCIVGKAIQSQIDSENPVPAFWDVCFGDGTFAKLESMKDWVLCPDYVGFMTDWQGGDGKFTYIVGMMMKHGCPLPDESFVSRTVNPSTAAVGFIQGISTQDVCMNAHALTQHAMEERGCSAEGAAWCMELYNCPRFTTPDEQGQIILDYYIPCASK